MFQLFWSWNALSSPLVREEWRQALALNRPHFVRPVYWEEPLPERAGLPPVELKRLHFQRVYPRIPSPPLPSPLPSPEPAPLQEPSRRFGIAVDSLRVGGGCSGCGRWTLLDRAERSTCCWSPMSQVQTAPPPATEPSTTPGSGGAVTAPPPVQNPAVENPSPAPAEPPSTAVKQVPTAVVEPPTTPTARRGAPPSRQGANPPATAKPQDQAPTAPVAITTCAHGASHIATRAHGSRKQDAAARHTSCRHPERA